MHPTQSRAAIRPRLIQLLAPAVYPAPGKAPARAIPQV
jgi:hypothetical protein